MLEIRPLISQDIASVAEIERLCFDEPWSENSLKLLLQERNIGFVAILDGQIAAYGGLVTVLDEGQITNIATHPNYRRLGLARRIMSAIDEFYKEISLDKSKRRSKINYAPRKFALGRCYYAENSCNFSDLW